MKRRAEKTFRSSLNTIEAKCPFCGYLANMSNPIKFCSGCGAKYHQNPRGQYIFDNKAISPLFLLQQAGGLKMGTTGPA